MKRHLLLAVVLAGASVAWANDFSFAQSKLKLSLPNEFSMLPRSEIDQLYAPGRGPGFVLGNPSRSLTVSNDLKDADLTGVSLALALPVFAKVFEERVPGLTWKERKVVVLEKQQWLQLEFVSKSSGTDYHNIMLITPIDNKMLVLNFSSALSEFGASQPVLREAIKGIALNVEVPGLIKGSAAPAAKKPKAAP